jgi:hypothetical protein
VATVELRVRWGLSWGAMTTNSYHRRSGGGVTVSWYGETEDESEEKEAMAADTWQGVYPSLYFAYSRRSVSAKWP